MGCVVNGASRADYLRLSAGEENAVVHVEVTADDTSGDTSSGATCSGVVVAPRWVLSARHCAPAAGAKATVRFGADTPASGCAPLDGEDAAAAAPATARIRLNGTNVVLHDELDLMLIELDTPWPLAALDVTPLPVGGDGDLTVGALGQLAGFGYRETVGGAALRRFVVEEVVAVDDRFVTVDGYGRSGLCAKDSGGPFLLRGDDGAVVTAGILHAGSADCLGRDAFTRLAGAAEWIRAHTATSDAAPARAEGSCAQLGIEGRCFGPVAAWCDGGQLHGERCPETAACGWSPAAAGFRCSTATDDPCGGVSDTGRCTSGATAVRCDAGELVVSSCSQCIRSPQTGVVGCAVSD